PTLYATCGANPQVQAREPPVPPALRLPPVDARPAELTLPPNDTPLVEAEPPLAAAPPAATMPPSLDVRGSRLVRPPQPSDPRMAASESKAICRISARHRA